MNAYYEWSDSEQELLVSRGFLVDTEAAAAIKIPTNLAGKWEIHKIGPRHFHSYFKDKYHNFYQDLTGEDLDMHLSQIK